MIIIFFFGGATTPIFLIRGGEEFGPQAGLVAFKYIGYAIPGIYNNFYIADVMSSYNKGTVLPEIEAGSSGSLVKTLKVVPS